MTAFDSGAHDARRLRRRLERRIDQTATEHGLWPEGGRLLVAISGGPDSTALLLALAALATRRSLELTAAYFDHRLRGEQASIAERSAVEALAAGLDVPLVEGAGDVRGLARTRRIGTEEAARHARYEFLASVAEQRGASVVATGHTASDQAETVLMHLLRGAGLTGLAGIAPSAAWPSSGQAGLRLVRPLLPLTRDDTLAYCRAAGAEPLQDESNDSPLYTRNRIRQHLLPALREYNPAVDAALVRLAEAARDDVAFIEAAALAAVSVRDSTVAFARAALKAWPQGMRRHAFRVGLKLLLGDLQGLGDRHLSALATAVDGPSGARLDLPRGVVASIERDEVVLSLGLLPSTVLPAQAVTLPVPGRAVFGSLLVAAGSEALPGAIASVSLDAEAVGGALTVRRRRPGDRFQPAGLTGTKKLQDFFVDAHVPRAERDAVPLFETPRGIAWIGGMRASAWAVARSGGAEVLVSYEELLP